MDKNWLIAACGRTIGITDNRKSESVLHDGILVIDPNGTERYWNPIDNDADAFRLATALQIGVFSDALGAYCNHSQTKQVRAYYDKTPCRYAAARLAICLAAQGVDSASRKEQSS